MTMVSFTWSTLRERNDGWVLEQGPDGSGGTYNREFGPMPPWVVPAFVEARRKVVALAAEAQGASYVDADVDYSYLLLDQGLIK